MTNDASPPVSLRRMTLTIGIWCGAALGVMFGLAIARGSVAEVLTVVDTIIASAAAASNGSSSAPAFSVANYVSALIAFHPKSSVSVAPTTSVDSMRRALHAFYEGTRWNFWSDKTNSSSLCTIDFNVSRSQPITTLQSPISNRQCTNFASCHVCGGAVFIGW